MEFTIELQLRAGESRPMGVLFAVARPTISVGKCVAIFLPDFSNLWPCFARLHRCVDFSGAALMTVDVHNHVPDVCIWHKADAVEH